MTLTVTGLHPPARRPRFWLSYHRTVFISRIAVTKKRAVIVRRCTVRPPPESMSQVRGFAPGQHPPFISKQCADLRQFCLRGLGPNTVFSWLSGFRSPGYFRGHEATCVDVRNSTCQEFCRRLSSRVFVGRLQPNSIRRSCLKSSVGYLLEKSLSFALTRNIDSSSYMAHAA